MLGVCGTAVVTEYYSTDFLEVVYRHGEGLPIRTVVSMALDAARGLQVGQISCEYMQLAWVMHRDGWIIYYGLQSSGKLSGSLTPYAESMRTSRGDTGGRANRR